MTVKVPQGFPVGTTLGTYVDRVGDVVPQGTPVSTAVVAGDSTITLTGLTQGIPYQVGATIGGKWRSFLIEIPVSVPNNLPEVIAELEAHEIDTSNVHGVVETTDLVTQAQLAAALGGLDLTGPLAALADGVKLVWKAGDGSVAVELWGDVTPAGYQVALVLDASTNDTATWVAYGAPHTNPGYDGVNHRYTGGDVIAGMPWGGQPDNERLVGQFHTGGSGGDQSGLWWGKDSGPSRRLNALLTVGSSDAIWESGYGSRVTWSGGWAPAANTTYWLRFARAGTVYTATVYDGDPDLGGNVLASAVYNLDATLSSGFYEGARTLYPFIMQVAASGSPWFDNVRLETVQAEARDLFVAVTAAGGVRTVRRIFGSSGSSLFRTDFGASASAVFARVTKSANQAIPNTDVNQFVTWDQEPSDAFAMHDSGNPTRLTIVQDGLYTVKTVVSIEGEGSPSGKRRLAIFKNGTTVVFREEPNAGALAWTSPIEVDVALVAGDYLEVAVAQNSSSNSSLNLLGGNPAYGFFSAARIG